MQKFVLSVDSRVGANHEEIPGLEDLVNAMKDCGKKLKKFGG
jgi:hypothetical protein